MCKSYEQQLGQPSKQHPRDQRERQPWQLGLQMVHEVEVVHELQLGRKRGTRRVQLEQHRQHGQRGWQLLVLDCLHGHLLYGLTRKEYRCSSNRSRFVLSFRRIEEYSDAGWLLRILLMLLQLGCLGLSLTEIRNDI